MHQNTAATVDIILINSIIKFKYTGGIMRSMYSILIFLANSPKKSNIMIALFEESVNEGCSSVFQKRK
jgi:hypothetical protein